MLVGQTVLNAGVNNAGQRARLYAHCAKTGDAGAVVIFGFNMGHTRARVNIGRIQIVEEYVLRPAISNLTSQTVFLNNKVLSLVEGKSMPELKPHFVTGDEMLIEGGTIGFWVLPSAGNINC